MSTHAASTVAVLAGLLLAPLSALAESPAAAESPAVAGQPAEDRLSTPPVDPLSGRRPTGWALQGLPIVNYNTDLGLGYGAQVMLVDRADGTYDPYRALISLQIYFTTANIFSHRLVVDLPRLLHTPWRLDVDFRYSQFKFNPYYGLGNQSEYVPAQSSCEDRGALAANPDECPGNPEFLGLRYHSYDVRSLPRLFVNLRYELSPEWMFFTGYRLRLEQVYLGYTAPEDLGQSRPSLLAEDMAAGLLPGFANRLADPLWLRTSEVVVGLLYDTRDIEASPTRGMYHELTLRGAAGFMGSQFNYWGGFLNSRVYLPVVPGYARLVAALRGLVDITVGEVPFTLFPVFGGLQTGEAIGGRDSVRGVLRNRYQGPAKVVLNGELRWTPLTLLPWNQQFDIGFVAFVDAGRVWRDLSFTDGGGFTSGAGGGLRIAWNREFIVRLDLGVGLTEPTTGFYLEFNQVF